MGSAAAQPADQPASAQGGCDVLRDGRLDQSMGDLFSAAAPFILTLILNGILFGIAVAVGFFLLIVPGLILITIWAVVAPSIVVENRGAIEAFGRRTRGILQEALR